MATTILVVPCFNEARRLSPEAFRHFAGVWRDAIFLFVDDGSTDGTFEILSALRQSIPAPCELPRLPENAGKLDAVHPRTIPEVSGMLHFLPRPCLLAH